MPRMVEVDEIGQVMHFLPLDRFLLVPVLQQRGNSRRKITVRIFRLNLSVTLHAGSHIRHAGMGARFDRRMTVDALNLMFARHNGVRKLDRLSRLVATLQIRRPQGIGTERPAENHGDQFAFEVAEQIIHHPVRCGDTPQRHTLGAATNKIPADLRAALALIEEHIGEPLTVPDIAARTGISQRQLERLFKRYIGCSAVQFGQLLRLQYARVLLTSTGLSIREVSVAAGFNSAPYFSQAFTRCFGKKPSEYRQSWPDWELAPSWPGAVSSFIETIKLPDRLPGQHPGR